MKSSQKLEIGKVYTRDQLRALFGITDATLNNGIFPHKGYQSVWLFVTEDKTADRTQYHDHLDGDTLTMQGQTMGRTDHYILHHQAHGNELILFHRMRKYQYPGAGFVYQGPFEYVSHSGGGPTTFQLVRATAAKSTTTRQLALDAVAGLDGRATASEVRDFILKHKPDYNPSNAGTDLDLLSVNSPSRTSHSYNKTPRTTDSDHDCDRLFKVGKGSSATYELYDQAVHGTWEIYLAPVEVSRTQLSVRLKSDPIADAIDAAQTEAEDSGAFDSTDQQDERDRVMATIVRRRGQRKFRNALLDAYNKTCAITECQVEAILEAAHIFGYKGDQTNVCSNGLLLRADIHTLFDLKLIAVNPDTMTVETSPALKGTEYEALTGRRLIDTKLPHQRPSSIELGRHRAMCAW
ncbi:MULTISPECIES: HNH endonuclease [Stenotrophomonas]|uniref:HNH endonuclease n=1 Tax=Stenotrophomonas TaxID=40323 RepID=UPI0006FCFECD|nr:MULTISPECIES: HNH endonuclease [Stenotrophomonas]KQN98140.1 hypothetical protein ASF01_09755 [Stenotrophomonas sp. Leaf70]